MNDKTLLCVTLPATRKSYDLWVPTDMTMHDASILIAGILESYEKDRFVATDTSILMVHDTGAILDPNCTVEEAGLVNGSRLVLV